MFHSAVTEIHAHIAQLKNLNSGVSLFQNNAQSQIHLKTTKL